MVQHYEQSQEAHGPVTHVEAEKLLEREKVERCDTRKEKRMV